MLDTSKGTYKETFFVKTISDEQRDRLMKRKAEPPKPPPSIKKPNLVGETKSMLKERIAQKKK